MLIFACTRQDAHFAPQDPAAIEPLPTIDSIAAQKRERLAASQSVETEAASGQVPASPEALQEEADSQGAFNPETGEINWDCPCLGGMAHGPCGEEFKAAFSCFVYSNEEPKGMDCIEKFKYEFILWEAIAHALMEVIGACRIVFDGILKSTAPSWKATTTMKFPTVPYPCRKRSRTHLRIPQNHHLRS